MTTKGFLPAITEKFPSSISSLSRALTLSENMDEEQKRIDSGDFGADGGGANNHSLGGANNHLLCGANNHSQGYCY